MDSHVACITDIENRGNYTSAILNKISAICQRKNMVMISIYDTLRDQFLYCSESFSNVLGYSPEELCSGGWKDWFELIEPLRAPEIKKTLSFMIRNPDVLRKEQPVFLSYHVKSASGDILKLHHEIRTSCRKDDHLLFNFLYDTTEHALIKALFGLHSPGIRFNGSYKDVHVSPRENEVLILLAEGFSSKQIAAQLYIGTQTVLTHRKHLMEKFNVRNTAQLIHKAALSQLPAGYYEM